jgi:hypothetical protein
VTFGVIRHHLDRFAKGQLSELALSARLEVHCGDVANMLQLRERALRHSEVRGSDWEEWENEPTVVRTGFFRGNDA